MSWLTLTFSWELASQSIASNSTTISWKMTLKSGGRISAGSKSPWSITVNGTQYDGAENLGFSSTSGGTKTLASGTTVIPHDSDGNKTFSYSFSQTFNLTLSGQYVGTKSGSGSGSLPFIARTSSPKLSATSADMGTKVTITTNRQSTSITHDLEYSFAGDDYVTFATGVGDSYAWTVPDLASKIPNAASGVCTIRCTTKAGGTTVGTNTLTLTVKVPASVVPTISSVAIAEATDGLAARFGSYIQHRSTLSVDIKAVGAKGSEIVKYLTYVIGTAYQGESFTSSPLQLSGNQKVVTTVFDSRGRTAKKETIISVTAYEPPIISAFRASRCDENGREDEKGVCLKLSYAYKTTTLNGRNTANMIIDYKRTIDDSYVGTIGASTAAEETRTLIVKNPTFSLDYQYDVRMTVSDWFGPGLPYVVGIRSEEVVLDISSNGKGVSFFKVSQRNGVENGKKIYDEFDTLVGNGLAVTTVSDVDPIDPDTTFEHLCVTDQKTPNEGPCYVITNFSGVKSANADRVQYFIPYNAKGTMYTRAFKNGAWTDPVEILSKTADYEATTGNGEIWTVRMWSDLWVECVGIREVSNIACAISAGNGWYKSYEFTPGTFPLLIENPVVSLNFESEGSGALMIPTTYATQTKTAKYYFMRPSNATIENGKIMMRVSGRVPESALEPNSAVIIVTGDGVTAVTASNGTETKTAKEEAGEWRITGCCIGEWKLKVILDGTILDYIRTIDYNGQAVRLDINKFFLFHDGLYENGVTGFMDTSSRGLIVGSDGHLRPNSPNPGYCKTNIMIDLTNFSLLSFNVVAYNGKADSFFGVSSDGSSWKAVGYQKTGRLGINVADFTGPHYIGVDPAESYSTSCLSIEDIYLL